MVAGMNPDQVLVAHIVKAVGFFALAGILVRRRAHLCWTFVAYLVTVLVLNSLISFWPEHFFNTWFWVLAHVLFTGLRMGIAVELTFRTFQAFPGAKVTARRLLFGLLLATSFALVASPDGIESANKGWYELVALDLQPRVLTGAIWLMNGLAILITWYRVPVHTYHKALLLGFVPYLLLFTVAMNLLKAFGGSVREYVGYFKNAGYQALLVYWAYTAWRPGPPAGGGRRGPAAVQRPAA
jgi:hypothetical protein